MCSGAIGIKSQLGGQIDISPIFVLRISFGPEVNSGLSEKIHESGTQMVATMKKACQSTDQAFSHILTFIKPGVTELKWLTS